MSLEEILKSVEPNILAGGKGERVKESVEGSAKSLTKRTPKVLHTINGNPLIDYPLEGLKRIGYECNDINVILREYKEQKKVENYLTKNWPEVNIKTFPKRRTLSGTIVESSKEKMKSNGNERKTSSAYLSGNSAYPVSFLKKAWEKWGDVRIGPSIDTYMRGPPSYEGMMVMAPSNSPSIKNKKSLIPKVKEYKLGLGRESFESFEGWEEEASSARSWLYFFNDEAVANVDKEEVPFQEREEDRYRASIEQFIDEYFGSEVYVFKMDTEEVPHFDKPEDTKSFEEKTKEMLPSLREEGQAKLDDYRKVPSSQNGRK